MFVQPSPPPPPSVVGNDKAHPSKIKPSFASVLTQQLSLDFAIDDLPLPSFANGMASVQISEEPYQRGLERCKSCLVGKLLFPPNGIIPKAHELSKRLRGCWPSLSGWSVAPLGKGFFMLQFQTLTDMQNVWSMGSINLNPGTLRLIKWSPSFSPATYKNTFAQVWVRFWDLGYAYWDHQTLFEIARGVGMPVKLDPKTANRSIGLYARVLVDVDFSRPLLEQLQVTRSQGDSVIIGVDYESKPDICETCGIVGHRAANCKVTGSKEPVPLRRGRSQVRSRHSKRHQSLKTNVLGDIEVAIEENEPTLPSHTPGIRLVVTDPISSEVGNPILDQVSFPVATVVLPVILAVPQTSSSIGSIPPGFLNKHLDPVCSASISALPVEVNGAQLLLGSSELEVNSVETPLLEEGEFTPVVTKKTKKLLKKSEKAKVKLKPTSCAPCSSRVLLRKGPKHKRF